MQKDTSSCVMIIYCHKKKKTRAVHYDRYTNDGVKEFVRISSSSVVRTIGKMYEFDSLRKARGNSWISAGRMREVNTQQLNRSVNKQKFLKSLAS